MMNAADEEPSQVSSMLMPKSTSNSNMKLISLNPVSNNSNLINDSFNLAKPSVAMASPAPLPPSLIRPPSGSPSLMAPPTINHFQPIAHSRTPSSDLNSQQTNTAAAAAAAINFFDQKRFSPSLATKNSDAPPAGSAIPANSSKESKSSSQSPAHLAGPTASPVPTMSMPPMGLQQQQQQQQTQQSMIAPPLSLPPQSSVAATGSNPYSARGALNKKVYDSTTVPVAPTVPNQQMATNFTQAPTPGSNPSMGSNIFVPNPALASTSGPPAQENLAFSGMPPSIPHSSSNLSASGASYAPPASFDMNGPNAAAFSNQLQISDNSSAGGHSNSMNQAGNNKTMWNWLTQNKIVNTFVEKAKHGVESLVTTIDPQMKDYIHPANRPIFLISSTSNMKLLSKIRESFNDAGFSKLTISYYDAQTSTQFAPQLVGFSCAQQACKEKLDNLDIYLQQQAGQLQQNDYTLIAFQDFLAELSTDNWYELAAVMFRDKTNNVELTVYTEAFPVSGDDINQLKSYTPQDYHLKWSGFSVRLPEKNFNFNTTSNQNTVLDYDTFDTMLSLNRIHHSLKNLAFIYKSKLLS